MKVGTWIFVLSAVLAMLRFCSQKMEVAVFKYLINMFHYFLSMTMLAWTIAGCITRWSDSTEACASLTNSSALGLMNTYLVVVVGLFGTFLGCCTCGICIMGCVGVCAAANP